MDGCMDAFVCKYLFYLFNISSTWLTDVKRLQEYLMDMGAS
jgi:hypothetical protein